MVEKYCNVKCDVIQVKDLKVIKCIGSAKFVNKLLFRNQCIYRLLFGFVWSCLLFNPTQPISTMEKLSELRERPFGCYGGSGGGGGLDDFLRKKSRIKFCPKKISRTG